MDFQLLYTNNYHGFSHVLSCLEFKKSIHEAATKLMQSKRRRIQHSKTVLSRLREKNYKAQKLVGRLRKRNILLKVEKKVMERKFRNADIRSFTDSIELADCITPQLKLALKTAVSVKKAKSKTGNRYEADWLLQSLLLKITSPKAYNHLRNEGILPLPNPKYLTQMLKGLKCAYGFNQFILNHLKKEFSGKTKQDKQVLLCFDEMKVKEAISFDRASMRFTGFIDYDEFSVEVRETPNRPKEADHALVFMIRAINSKMTQPIGVFATRGAAPGNVLAKMVISAILKVEACGLEVVGVVSDGATTNKSCWKHLGIIGTAMHVNNKIVNPVDNSRNVHFICDMPHVIKCIRNHFQSRKIFQYSGQQVNWGFYEAVYDLDKQSDLRAVPKITYHHINPGPFQKMSVSRAAQVLSKSMADAIKFYRDVIKSRFLVGSEATENLTRALNALFGATNSRLPKDGITPDSGGFKIISEFLLMLSTSNSFASEVTLASLRVTLQSILDIVTYLCNDIGYRYVLTAKFNQDCLEKFFGLCRYFGGDDCHPTITSFGHIFRLLSIFNPTKRIVKGNVRPDEEVSVSAISYCDALKQMRVTGRGDAEKFRKDLENIILNKIFNETSGTSSLLDTSDFSRMELAATDYLAYHLSGYIAFKGQRFTNCQNCLECLCDESFRPQESRFTCLRDMGGLKHPSANLFNLLARMVEPCLAKLKTSSISSPKHMIDILNSMDNFNCNGLGCSEDHSGPLSIEIILYYNTVRMYFYSKIHNREKLSSVVKSKQKIKEGKLQ